MTFSFTQALQAGVEAARNLLENLEREREALVADDLDGFLQLTEGKKERIAALEAFDRQRLAALRQAGLGEDEAGMEALLAGDPRADTLWRELLHVLQSCQRLNEINGRIIQARKRQVEQALSILRGQLGSEKLAYDRQGRITGTDPGLPLGKV